MRCVITNAAGSFSRIEDRVPICGVHFCDQCGDCLDCYEGDPCYDRRGNEGTHSWVVEEEA